MVLWIALAICVGLIAGGLQSRARMRHWTSRTEKPRCEACGGPLDGVNVDGEAACSNYGCARWMVKQEGQEVE